MNKRIIFSSLICASVSFAFGQHIAAQCMDEDQDGFAHETTCSNPSDCNDADPATFPGAPELCNGYDNNCDELVDNDPACLRSCNAPEKVGADHPLGKNSISGAPTPVVWTGSQYGIAWVDNRTGKEEIYFTRLDTEGQEIGTELLVSNNVGDSQHPWLEWNGTEFAAVWLQDVPGGGWDTYFGRISGDGVPIGANVRVGGPGTMPRLEWTGAYYGVVWGGSDLIFALTDRAGQTLTPPTNLTSTGASVEKSEVVWNGAVFGIAYDTSAGIGNRDIFFLQVDAVGNLVSAPIQVSGGIPGPASSWRPTLAWTGSEYAIAWVDDPSVDFARIQFTRVDNQGAEIGDEILVHVSTATVDGQDVWPSLVWAGAEFGLVWGLPSLPSVLFQRVGPGGELIGHELLAMEAGENRLAMTWRGGEYAIVGGSSFQSNQLIFSRIACGLSPTIPTVACDGFAAPLDNGAVTVRGHRVLPLKARLFDQDGLLVTDSHISAPPLIQVLFETGAGGDPVDVTGDALPPSQGTEGNQFFFDEDYRWHLNFGTRDYTAPGTYLLFMDTGDSSEYVIDPTCYAEFIRD